MVFNNKYPLFLQARRQLPCLAAFALLTACADSGRALQEKRQADLPIQNQDQIDTGVRPDVVFLQPQLLPHPMDNLESCRAAEDLPDPWMTTSNEFPFQVGVEGGTKVQIGRNQQGLWLHLAQDEAQHLQQNIEIQLTRVRLDAFAWLQAQDVRSFSWRSQGIFHQVDGSWQKIQDQRLARSWQSAEGVTIFFAHVLVDTALEGMYWGIELGLKADAKQMQKLGQWMFRGEAPVWPGFISSQHCQFSNPDFQLATLEIWDESRENPLNEKKLMQQLGLLRRALLDASYSLRSLRQSPISVPILIIPQSLRESESFRDKSGILWLDREMAAENNLQMRQSIKVYQEGLHYLTRRILRESLSMDDEQWLDIMSWAMTDRFLAENKGLYEQVMIFQQDLDELQAPEQTQRRQLSHLFAHHFATSQLVAAWRRCLGQFELQDCLLEELFADRSPDQMAGWLWSADDFHADWQPSLVQDDDGDGLINLLEGWQGSDPLLVDTDRDGWGDLVEYIQKTDARSSVSHPAGLVVDGWFDDWIALYPHKVKANPSPKTTLCPNVELLYFSVFQAKDWLLAGAKLANPQAAAVRWELSVDYTKMDHKILVQQDSGQRYSKVALHQSMPEFDISIVRPFRNQTEDLELLLEDVWLKQQFEMSRESPTEWLPFQPNLKITVYALDQQGQWQFCEDTPWFAPVAVEEIDKKSKLSTTF